MVEELVDDRPHAPGEQNYGADGMSRRALLMLRQFSASVGAIRVMLRKSPALLRARLSRRQCFGALSTCLAPGTACPAFRASWPQRRLLHSPLHGIHGDLACSALQSPLPQQRHGTPGAAGVITGSLPFYAFHRWNDELVPLLQAIADGIFAADRHLGPPRWGKRC